MAVDERTPRRSAGSLRNLQANLVGILGKHSQLMILMIDPGQPRFINGLLPLLRDAFDIGKWLRRAGTAAPGQWCRVEGSRLSSAHRPVRCCGLKVHEVASSSDSCPPVIQSMARLRAHCFTAGGRTKARRSVRPAPWPVISTRCLYGFEGVHCNLR